MAWHCKPAIVTSVYRGCRGVRKDQSMSPFSVTISKSRWTACRWKDINKMCCHVWVSFGESSTGKLLHYDSPNPLTTDSRLSYDFSCGVWMNWRHLKRKKGATINNNTGWQKIKTEDEAKFYEVKPGTGAVQWNNVEWHWAPPSSVTPLPAISEMRRTRQRTKFVAVLTNS